MAPLVGSSTGSVAFEPRLTALPADSAPQMTTEAAADATAKKTRKRIDKTAAHRELRLMRRENAVANDNFEKRMAWSPTTQQLQSRPQAGTHEARAEEPEHEEASEVASSKGGWRHL